MTKDWWSYYLGDDLLKIGAMAMAGFGIDNSRNENRPIDALGSKIK